MCLAAVQRNWWALKFVPEDLRDENMCRAAVQRNWWALKFVPADVQLAHPAIPFAAVKQDIRALQFVPEAVQLANPDICRAAVQQDGCSLEYVPEDVQMTHPDICRAAVGQNGCSLEYVPESLKTNVDALAKLYTTSEEQLRSDLRLLQIHVDVINQVICYLKAPIATSSSMIVGLLGTGNDSKQTAENTVNSIDIISADLLPMIEGYVYTPPISENDAKESNGFSPL
jgi:hypothetical protein